MKKALIILLLLTLLIMGCTQQIVTKPDVNASEDFIKELSSINDSFANVVDSFPVSSE